MGYFDEMFDTRYMFDNETKQRRDIEELRSEVGARRGDQQEVRRLNARIDRLELIVEALTEALLRKGVLRTRAEMAVLMQQLDLLDGVEDGKMRKHVHQDAPTCHVCGRYINPRRGNCVFCGTAVKREAKAKVAKIRMVDCTSCEASVPERESYFSDDGVVCGSCFTP